MSLAFDRNAYFHRAVAVLRAGTVARDLCRRGGGGKVAALFDRSFYLRIGEDFVCIGEPAIGNGPTVLIVAARVAELGARQGQRAVLTNKKISIGDLLLDLGGCETWRAPAWPAVPSPASLLAICADIARRAAEDSPADSLARATFGADDTPFARLARPRIADFAGWLSERISASSCPAKAGHPVTRSAEISWQTRCLYQQDQAMICQSSSSAKADDPVTTELAIELRHRCLLDAPLSRGMTSQRSEPLVLLDRPLSRAMTNDELAGQAVRNLAGLGPGLTPSGDDFLTAALAALDALEQTSMRVTLGRAVVGAAAHTSPLSASFLRAAAAGQVGENLYTMLAALIGGNADAAIAAAERIGHTSGWDTLAGAVVTMQVVAAKP